MFWTRVAWRVIEVSGFYFALFWVKMEVFDEIKKIERMIEAMQESETGIIFK